MASAEPQVAIYIDFDNVVISRASQARTSDVVGTVAIDVLLDFATRYGRVAISRAYADWSVKKNADYRDQLVARAVELVQLFPAAKTKNGADIRLAVDAVEDLYLHPALTHLVIVAGDSDYVPLAQRARRLGRVVLGIGVAGSISKALASACDVYVDYDELLEDRVEVEVQGSETESASAPATAADGGSATSRRAYTLFVEALRGLDAQHPEREVHPLGAVKNQVLRIDPTFKESAYGAASFGKLLERYKGQIEVKDNTARLRNS